MKLALLLVLSAFLVALTVPLANGLSMSVLKQQTRAENQLTWDKDMVNAICTAWKNAGPKTRKSMTEDVCPTLSPEYTVKVCRELLESMETQRTKKKKWGWNVVRTVTNSDCDWLKKEHRDTVDLDDWEDIDMPDPVDLDSLDLKGRIGEEDEISPEIFAWNKDGSSIGKKVGIVRYGQVAAQSASIKVGTKDTKVPLLAVTLDGIGPYPWHDDTDKDNVNRVAIAKEFKLNNDLLKKDNYGFTGIIEVVTGPVPNTHMIQHMKALKIFFQALKDTTKCDASDSDVTGNLMDASDLYPDTYDPPFYWTVDKKAVKLAVLLKKYNAEIIKDHDLLDWKLDPVTYAYRSPEGSRSVKSKYEWYVTCATETGHSVQVNFAVPVDAYGTDALEKYMGADGKLYHKRSREHADRMLSGTTADGDAQIKGIFTLMNFIALVKSYNAEFQPTGTAADKKNEYDLLPKINVPDLVRWLPSASRVKVKAWYDAKKDSFHDLAEAAKTNFGITWGSKDLTGWKTKFGTELEAAMTQTFTLKGCSRYESETTSAYGTGVKSSVHTSSAPAGCSYLARYLPGHRVNDKAYLMLETRLHPAFIPDLTTDLTTNYGTAWSASYPKDLKDLVAVQDSF